MSGESVGTHTADDAYRMVEVTVNLVNKVVDFINEYMNKNDGHPLPCSQADVEPCGLPDPDLLKTAYSQGGLLVRLAIDEVIAFSRTVIEPACAFAPWTCVRAVLEASALAAWLLDLKTDARTRLARCLAFRYEGLRQQATFWRVAGEGAKADAIDSRIAETERIALGLGFRAQKAPNGKCKGIAMVMPRSTALVKQMLDQEGHYRLLSVVIHGHSWALIRLGMQEVNRAPPRWANHLSADAIVTLCLMTTTAITRPTWYMCRLYGWDAVCLASIFDTSYDSLGISNAEYRFWR